MTRNLTLYFRNVDGEEVDFVLMDDDRLIDRGTVRTIDLEERIPDLQILPSIVVIPGETVTTWCVKTPPGSRRHLRKIMPFLLEEELAGPPESVHIALKPVTGGSEIVAMVIDKTVLQGWLDQFSKIGIRCMKMVPDHLLLAMDDQPRMARRDGRIIAGFTDGTGIAMSENVLSLLPDADWQIVDDSDLITLARLHYSGVDSFNLLQGAYQQKEVQSQPVRHLKVAILALALAAILHIGYFLAAGNYFHRQGNIAYQEAEQIYRTLFPEEVRIVNIRRQMEGRLKVTNPSRSTDHFLDLVAAVATATSSDTLTASRIKHLNFSSQQNRLIADIDVNSLTDIQYFGTSLADPKIVVEVLGAAKEHDSTSARIALSRIDAP